METQDGPEAPAGKPNLVQALEAFRRTLLCTLCNQLFKDCHTLPTCGHSFCYECVIDTLEGPGINKSVCPQCSQPCWKKELHRNYTFNSLVGPLERAVASVQSGSGDEAALAAACDHLRQQLGAAQPAAASRGGQNAPDPVAARPPSGRRRSAKPRRRGRSVPEEEQQQQGPPAQPQQEQPGQLEPALVSAAAAAAAAAAAPEKVEAGAAAEAAARAAQAGVAAAGAPGPDGAAPITPEPVVYDSDWEARMLAMSPPPAEELPQLEAEVELLRQAVLLCDQMVAARSSGLGGGGSSGAAAAPAAAAAAQAPEQQQAGAPCPQQQAEPQHQQEVQQAGDAETVAAAAEQQQQLLQQQAAPAPSSSPPRDRKRQAVALQPGGIAEPEEGSPCMAGRKRRRGFSGRGRRTGQAACSEAAATATASLAAPQQQPPAACPAAGGAVPLAPVLTDGNSSSDEDDFKPPPAGLQRSNRTQLQQQQESPQQQQRAAQGVAQPRPPRNYHEKRLAAKARQFEEVEAAFAPPRRQRQQHQLAHQQAQQAQHDEPQQQQVPQQAQTAQQQHQQQQQDDRQRLRCGDAVEVMFKLLQGSGCGSDSQGEGSQLVPYHGVVTALEQHEGCLKHYICYPDGDNGWTNLAEEEWRRLSGDEALAARLQLGMQEQEQQPSPAQQASLQQSSQEQQEGPQQQEEDCPTAAEEHQQRQQSSPAPVLAPQQAHGSPALEEGACPAPDSSGAAAGSARAPGKGPEDTGRAAGSPGEGPGGGEPCKPANTRQPAVAAAARVAAAPAPQPVPATTAAALQSQAAAAAPPPPACADPYLFISNTEAVTAAALGADLLQAAAARRQQQKQQHQAPRPVQPLAGRRPVAPPPKFHQPLQQQPKHSRQPAKQPQEPAWLQPRLAAAASGLAQPAPGSTAQQQQQFSRKRKGSEQAAAAGATALLKAAAEAASGGSGSRQPQHDAEMVVAEDEPLLGTQDAAGALFTMLQAQQPAAAGTAEPLPLRPTSRHNAASAAGAADTAAAAGAAAAGTPVGFVAASQLFEGLPPMHTACTAQRSRQHALQDPGLFGSSPGAPGCHDAAAAGAAAACEDPGQLRLPDLFKGATPSQPFWLPDSGAAVEDAGMAAGPEEAAAAQADECSAVSPVGVRIVISNTTAEIQQKVLRLQQVLPGVELQEHVTEHTTHVLVPVDDRGIVGRRSVQYLLGLAHGCWVVSYQWVDACLSKGGWVAERNYQAQGSKEGMHAPARSRQRHHGPDARPGAGLFAGRRVHVIADGSRQSTGGTAGSRGPNSHHIQAMVAAEGGEVARSLGPACGARPPSPEGGTLLVFNPTSRPGLAPDAVAKQLQKRYPGRTVVHAAWVYDSLCQSRGLDPGQYAISEAQPVPLAVMQASQAGGCAGGSQLGGASQLGG
ncbi:hypothetical protein ABPG75_012603 [Micractinium tetrahymenae]